MKKLFYFTLILFSFFTSCHDDDNQNPNVLPEATQVGANTGGTLIDGKVWVAKKEFPDLNPGGNNTEYNSNLEKEYKLRIILNGINSNERIILYIEDNVEITQKKYLFINKNGASYDKNLQNFFSTKYESKGSITITKFDKKNKFVSGIFHFEAVNGNGDGTKVVVTEGRFDKKYL